MTKAKKITSKGAYVTVDVCAVEECFVLQGLEGSFDVLRGVLLHEGCEWNVEPRAGGREFAQVDVLQVACEGASGSRHMMRILKTHLSHGKLGRITQGEEN